MIWGRSPRTLPDSALGLGAVPAAAQRSEARNGVDAEGPRGSRGYPEQGSDVAECRPREIRGVGGRLEITRPRCVMKQLNAGLRTRLHPDPCFGGEKPPRSWVGAGCRQEPRSKAGSERGGLISNSSTSETKPNPKKKKQLQPDLCSSLPPAARRALTATPRSQGRGTHTPQHLGPQRGLGPRSVLGRGAHEAGAAPTGRPSREVLPRQGGLAPCPRHYRHSSAIGRGSRAAWVRPRARFFGVQGAQGAACGAREGFSMQEAGGRAWGGVGSSARQPTRSVICLPAL